MSLLLLFPSESVTGSAGGWTIVICPGVSWSGAECEQKSTWGEWSSLTWGHIYDSPATSNQSWDYMAGYTFQATTCSATSWATTTC